MEFVGASYVAIAIMFAIHGILLGLAGVNVRSYFKTVWPVLTFAFTSRSSAATIPLNVETQVDGPAPEPIANLSATFGATIGQNGCAGIYPAMLAVMIAPSMGIDPLSFSLYPAPRCHRRHQFLRYCRGWGRRDLRSAGGAPSHGLRHRGGGADFRGTAHRYGAHGSST